MMNDTRRESDQNRETRGEALRRREMDARTRDAARAMTARGVGPGGTEVSRRGPESLPRLSAREQMTRFGRIADHSAMRDVKGFDPMREQQLEDFEIRTSPTAFLDRRDHAGLDAGTVKLVRHSLEAHGIKNAADLKASGISDTWGVFDAGPDSE